MSYQVLARKWRPKQFSEVVGQEHIVAALSNALDSKRVHHAFLFTGTRGVGKTTLARIFAKALNCETGVSAQPCGECMACQSVAAGNYLDLIEVDAASRTKVDDTRDLLDNVQYAPTQGRYKVYLIDEVHMLSTHSFNALLKTLEEPPEHVKFLLATTDPQKLPMTILSRCIQFSLNAIEPEAIVKQLAHILTAEQIEHESAALAFIARAANGSMRDALSLLDQAIAFGNQQVTEKLLRKMLGMIDAQQVSALVGGLIQANYQSVQTVVEAMVRKSANFAAALDDLLSLLHAISAYQFSPKAIAWKDLDQDMVAQFASQLSPEQLQLYYQIVLHGKRDLHLAPDPRTGFEMAMLRLFAFAPQGVKSTAPGLPLAGSRGDEEHKQPRESKTSDAKVAPSPIEAKASDVEQGNPAQEAGQARQNLQPALDQDQVVVADSIEPTMPNKAADDLAANNERVSDNAAPIPEPIPETRVESKPMVEPETQSQPVLAPESAPPSLVEETQETLEIQPITAEKFNFSLDKAVSDISLWSEVIASLSLNGMARQLALHLSPNSYDAGKLAARLDDRYTQLLNPDRLTSIETQLNAVCAQTVKLHVEMAQVDAALTCAGFDAEQARARTEATRKSFQEDPAVQEMVDIFDATIDVNSIKQA